MMAIVMAVLVVLLLAPLPSCCCPCPARPSFSFLLACCPFLIGFPVLLVRRPLPCCHWCQRRKFWPCIHRLVCVLQMDGVATSLNNDLIVAVCLKLGAVSPSPSTFCCRALAFLFVFLCVCVWSCLRPFVVLVAACIAGVRICSGVLLMADETSQKFTCSFAFLQEVAGQPKLEQSRLDLWGLFCRLLFLDCLPSFPLLPYSSSFIISVHLGRQLNRCVPEAAACLWPPFEW